MKYFVFIVAALGVPPLSFLLHMNRRWMKYAFWGMIAAMGLYHSTSINFFSDEFYRGSSRGMEVSLVYLFFKEQLDKAGCPERAELPFQKAVLNDELPFTIGGGIGQSRICMFFLRKAHIGEVQCSLWPEETVKALSDHGIPLL